MTSLHSHSWGGVAGVWAQLTVLFGLMPSSMLRTWVEPGSATCEAGALAPNQSFQFSQLISFGERHPTQQCSWLRSAPWQCSNEPSVLPGTVIRLRLYARKEPYPRHYLSSCILIFLKTLKYEMRLTLFIILCIKDNQWMAHDSIWGILNIQNAWELN